MEKVNTAREEFREGTSNPADRESSAFGHETAARALSDEMIPVPGGRYLLPRRFTARVDDTSLPWMLTLTAAVGDDGEPYCEEFAVKARPGERVLSSHVRFPLKQFLRLASAAVRVPSDHTEGGARGPMSGWAEHRAFVEACAPDRPPAGTRGPKGKQYDDEHFEEVAARFLEAPKGTTGIQYLQQTWPTSYGTAKRWVDECRKRDLLPPAKPRGRTSTTR